MPSALVVETVTAATMAELRRARDEAIGDLVELRLDGVTDVDVAGALEGRRTSVIVTCRPRWEGGAFDGSEEERLALLSEAVRLGAEYVDLELAADWQRVPRSEGTRLVLSLHDFEGVPRDLRSRVQALRAANPDIVKVSVMANRLDDCVELRDVMAGATGAQIAIAMGSIGQISRVCPWLFGSCWTYGGAAAPGQLTPRALIKTYRVQRGSGATTLYAIGGSPLSHSASPAIHNAAFTAMGLDSTFTRLETTDAAEFLRAADAFGLVGASITAPLKSSFFAHGVVGDDTVDRVGALNTVRRHGTLWEGRNFDLDGFMAPLKSRRYQLDERQVVVLGAGGAARAAAFALSRHGGRVAISARRPAEAARVAADLAVGTTSWPPPAGWDLLVNATPVGTASRGEGMPIPLDNLAGRLVYDLVYNPLETDFMKSARAGGAETIGGLEMLTAQAACQFEWWTGTPAPTAVMERAAREFIQEAQGRA